MPPGPIGMYFCGPTVYQRIHIGNAVPVRPVDVAQAMARAARATRRRSSSTSPTSTTRSTTRRPAQSAGARRARDAVVPRGHRPASGSGGRTSSRPPPRPFPTDPDDRGARSRGGFAYESDGDVYFRVRQLPRLRRLSRQKLDEVARAGAEPAQGGSARLRALEGEQARMRTRRGSRPGGTAARAGTSSARRCPRSTSGRASRSTAAALDLVFPHHENEIAQSRALGHDFARIWMHNGMLSLRGRGDAQVRRQRRRLLRRCSTAGGTRPCSLFFMTGHWRKPLDFSDETMTAAAAQAETLRNALRGETRSARRLGRVRRSAGGRLQHAGGARDPARVGADRGPRGATSRARRVRARRASPSGRRRRPRSSTLAEARIAARASRDFAEADRLRDEIAEHGWEVRDVAAGYELVPRA